MFTVRGMMSRLLLCLLMFICLQLWADEMKVKPDLTEQGENVSIPSYLIAQDEVVGQVSDKLTYDESHILGTKSALTQNNTNGWIVCGFLSGASLSLIGMAIIYSSVGGSVPRYVPENCNANGYRAGYYQKAKTRNKKAALSGSAVGVVALAGFVYYLDHRDEW